MLPFPGDSNPRIFVSFFSAEMLQQQNRGLILFNKLSTAAATSQGPQYVDFYSQEEHSEIISDLNDLLKYQESHCHACDTSRLHDHYHCAATVGMPLIQFYHRPHPMEAVAEKDATEREMLALKRSTKLPFGPWEQKIFYDEDLEAQQENILTTWFNGFLFGPPTAVSNKRTFDYEEFFR